MPLGSNGISGGSVSEIGKRKVIGKIISGAGARFFAKYHVSASNLVLWLDQGDQQSGTSDATWDDLSGREVSGQDNDMKQATASYQPAVTGAFPGYRDFDGDDNYMHQKIYDDESGATFWPTNAGAAFNATNARFRVAGVDLSAFASAANDYMLVIHDSADKTAWGYIDLADSAEALGGELITAQNDRDFSSGSIGNWTLSTDGTGTFLYEGTDPGAEKVGELTSAGNETYLEARLPTSRATSLTDGKPYKLTARIYVSAANILKAVKVRATQLTGSPVISETLSGNTWTTVSLYFIAGSDVEGSFEVGFSGIPTLGDILYFDDISVKEVTNVGTDGVLIMSTKGGTTQSWALQESGIDLNDIDSFEVLKSDNQILTALSAFMWVKPDDGQPGTDDALIAKWRAADGFRSIVLELLTTGKLRVSGSSDGADNTETETTDAAFFSNGAETWHQIGFVFNGTTIVIYGNAVALASTTGGGGIPAALYDVAEKLTIGALSTPGSYFAGLVGPVNVFERALTADEVLRLYQADYARFK